MTTRFGRLLSLIAAATIGQVAWAQEPPARPVNDRLRIAEAACGGGPIQNGHPVQPNPSRDACLARFERHGQTAETPSPPPTPADKVTPPPEDR